MDSKRALLIIELIRFVLLGMLMDTMILLSLISTKRRRIEGEASCSYSLKDRLPGRITYLDRLTWRNERNCINLLRMGRNALSRLCVILRESGGLTDSREVTVVEQVCIFLGVLLYHKKQYVAEFEFERSGRTVSKYFHIVLKAVLKLHRLFLATETPVEPNSTDHTWKWFKGCLGALDGTLIEMTMPEDQKGPYRSRKGKCHVNVLGFCNRKCNFTYLLTGWEGSAANGRVLSDVVRRPNGLRVPEGNYYLCDAGYTNGPGFLSPLRGVRYHIQEWGSRVPHNDRELFNKRHSSARMVIERAWGILKKRWAILRSPSFYNIPVQNQIIMACALLHNFIRTEMDVDPFEVELDMDHLDLNDNGHDAVYVESVEPTPAWTHFRDEIAEDVWNSYRNRG